MPTPRTKASGFRLQYILFPLIVLLLSFLITVIFVGRLPDEVAYRFTRDGEPEAWLSRNAVISLLLLPQIAMTLMAMGIVGLIAKLGVLAQAGSASGGWIKPGKETAFMGNAFGLPQAVLFFVTLDIFSYNSYRIHLVPTWLLLVIAMVLATVAMVALFLLVMARAR
ncbi:MAG: DUF1648 domain-containing protein [Chloroflexi bacterium]|nr:DUF1648 domain-containing protein [Chloroflexota bacterium]